MLCGTAYYLIHMRNLCRDVTRTPRVNLETILEISFPRRQSIDIETNECGICYNYDITTETGAEVPIIKCLNVSCGKIYHQSCIVEWMQASPTTKSSFDVLFGACPYCQDIISVAKVII